MKVLLVIGAGFKVVLIAEETLSQCRYLHFPDEQPQIFFGLFRLVFFFILNLSCAEGIYTFCRV